MPFPKYNPHSDLSEASYYFLKEIWESKEPQKLWTEFSGNRAEAFEALLRIYMFDSGVVLGEDAKKMKLDAEKLRLFWVSASSFTTKELYEEMAHFIDLAPEYGAECAKAFIEEDLAGIIQGWGAQALDFFRWYMLERPFHHLDRDTYVDLSGIMFQMTDIDGMSGPIEDIYVEVMKNWEWNDLVVNADSMEALSLLRSIKALPHVVACLEQRLFDEAIIRANIVKKNYGQLFVVTDRHKDEVSGAPPKYAGDQNFGKILHAIAYMDIGSARLMALSEMFSPIRGKPSSLMHGILGWEVHLEGDEPYQFINAAEAQRFSGQVMAFWNDCLRFKEKLPELKRPESLITAGLFFHTDVFFQGLLDDLAENPSAFTAPQKNFLRAYRNLHEEFDDWWEGLGDKKFEKNNPELEKRLLELWGQMPRFI